jgi:hypothetical protein
MLGGEYMEDYYNILDIILYVGYSMILKTEILKRMKRCKIRPKYLSWISNMMNNSN